MSRFSAMGSPLLAVRFVFLAFLIILSVFVMVFAIWNVKASTSAGLNVTISTIIFFINAALTFVFVGLGVADFAVPEKHVFPLWSECVFSAMITCLYMGTSVGAIAQAATICKWDLMQAQCTSVVLLLPVGWIATATFLIHCLAVIVLTASRSEQDPEIWSSSMCSTAYFEHEQAKSVATVGLTSQLDLEANTPKDVDGVAPWAPPEQGQIRRGRDAPFKLPTPKTTPAPTPTIALQNLPPPPTRVHFRSESAEAYGGYVRPTHHPQAGSQSSLSMSVDSFPARVINADAPIPLPDRSKWVRAEPGEVPIYNRFATATTQPNPRQFLPTTPYMMVPRMR